MWTVHPIFKANYTVFPIGFGGKIQPDNTRFSYVNLGLLVTESLSHTVYTVYFRPLNTNKKC